MLVDQSLQSLLILLVLEKNLGLVGIDGGGLLMIDLGDLIGSF